MSVARARRPLWIVTGLGTLALTWFFWHGGGDHAEPIASPTPAPASLAVREPPATRTLPAVIASSSSNVIQPLPEGEGGTVGEHAETPESEQAAAARVLDELQWLIKASAIHDVTAHVEDTELVIVTPPGGCDVALLRNLGDTLVSFQIDPGRSYSGLRCAGTSITVTLR